MAFGKVLLTVTLIAAAAPAAALARDMGPAPAGTAGTRYCMRIEAMTGSRIEPVVCWTRERWAGQGVDVDKDWPSEGVRVIG